MRRALRAPTPTETESRGPGTYERSFEFGGRTRTYQIHFPPDYDKRTPVPLVLAFHGLFGTAEAQQKLSGFNDVSDRHGFIAVYPEGVRRSWNAGHGTSPAARMQIDDVGFVSALIEKASRDSRIDQHRIYATGMSNGAVLVYRLACELPDKIAAIATVAGVMVPEVAQRCEPKRPISVLAINGTADPLVDLEDDESGKDQKELSGKDRKDPADWVSATIKKWVELDGCPATPAITKVGADVIQEMFAPCREGTEVVLYKIVGGGHTWPGGKQYLPRVLTGKTSDSLNASEIMWAFFAKHSVP